MGHTFHIPVLGLGFSVDTPIKVARFGISSVASIVDDMLIERMRKYHTEKRNEVFKPIEPREQDSRAKRITAYLNLMERLVKEDFETLRNSPFELLSDITRYFDLLPESSPLKRKYREMLGTSDVELKSALQQELRAEMRAGSIDVNIMSKVDKMNLSAKKEPLAEEYSDALAALRGFAESTLKSSVVLSAGMNPRLYSYLENFRCFLPDESGDIEKRVILKVSDFRSAFIQAKFLAKKGIWVSEFRIESGLNCGGHAFATEGFLLGPILEEFKLRRQDMVAELFSIYQPVLAAKSVPVAQAPDMKISVQGGIGTAEENSFLLDYYGMDATGWGSPFLLVPEATNVDNATLSTLVDASQDDFYISGSSPLGIPFNNFRKSTAEKQRLERIAKGRPGSPCTKKFLVSNTEFTAQPICTASREYQDLKIRQLQAGELTGEEYQVKYESIVEKLCLCEGLTASAYRKNDMLKPRENNAVAICPGPNVAWFSGVFSLDEMVKHIYGSLNLLHGSQRPNMFINELNLYIDYLKKDIETHLNDLSEKKAKYFAKFSDQLLQGIAYYKGLMSNFHNQAETYIDRMKCQIEEAEMRIALLRLENELAD
ncbi:hypothetical protein GZH53_14530 [Flavihumibacter sp. R14]|nr:hypothetical protein [Flavihumibacter soli]